MKNTRILNALKRQAVDQTPVWLMRQAGRYLPEYRAIRKEVKDFVELCQTPELAAEVTLQPLRRYALDAAILFSDILTIPDAMGLGLYFIEGQGPKFKQVVRSAADVDALPLPDPYDHLDYVLKTITRLKPALMVPLLGFSGSPWTLACYMVEGGASKTFGHIKAMLYQQPQALHALLDKLAQSVAAYLNAQIATGCDAVMLFDTWGGVLTTAHYQAFSLAYMKKIIQAIRIEHPTTPVTVFTKNGSAWLELIVDSGCDCVSVDWTLDLAQARARIGDKVALQGNLDPAALYAKPADIRAAVKAVLQSYGKGPGHIFNLGHGMQPDFNPDHVAVLVDAVHELSQAFHE